MTRDGFEQGPNRAGSLSRLRGVNIDDILDIQNKPVVANAIEASTEVLRAFSNDDIGSFQRQIQKTFRTSRFARVNQSGVGYNKSK